jgi:hypothetical protein
MTPLAFSGFPYTCVYFGNSHNKLSLDTPLLQVSAIASNTNIITRHSI